MSAKEMFEEAGYFYDKALNKIVIFETWYDTYGELHHSEVMRFKNIDNKWWRLIPKKKIVLDFSEEIDIKLFKAINKQVEELGGVDND